ncbi:MAG: lysophospholipid acyltransferase family protein [Acidobacteriaceae bacterium]
MRERVEFGLVWLLVKLLGLLPRDAARKLGAAIGWLAFAATPRLRRVGLRNLELAFPEKPEAERESILREMYRQLGWQLAEFCHMQGYTLERANELIRYEGLENYLAAKQRGQGVLVLTGHLGAWEMSSFYHSLAGYPMGMVIRKLDNPWVNRLVNDIRTRHGNRVLPKDDFARGLIAAMRAGETVGVLMDTNMTPPQGVFVDFFGHAACTASGVARVALRTGATVLPGFLVWQPAEKKYVLHFLPELQLVDTGDAERDATANTQVFTTALENVIRQFPEQWLWVHRRWKTRPPGEPAIY